VSVSIDIQPDGEHEYVVRLESGDEVADSWVHVAPEALAGLGVPVDREEAVVHRTVEFLLRHQEVPDFPRIVELEDVVASYADFARAIGAGDL